MPSTAIDSQIHGCMFSTDEMREILSDKAWVQKWLDTEAALAAAQANSASFQRKKPTSSINTLKLNSSTFRASANTTRALLRSYPC